MTEHRKLLVTMALPYANGPLHLGHLVGFVHADMWVRFQRLMQRECHFISGDDAHGTAIMLKAEQMGMTPEQLIAQIQAEHTQDLADFGIELNHYHTTHCEENRELSELIFKRLQARGDISTKTIKHAYDPEKNMFLPDRFIKGTCPRCKAEDQYGDGCEQCGATYATSELINPRSAVSGATPIEKESLHYFFELPHYLELLQTWTQGKHLQEQVSNKLKEWFDTGLQPWDISRDAPYFGFKIPGEDHKYFYVWLDAPIGYMASFKHYCDKNKLSFDEYWQKESKTELYHFIGKDIIYFHAMFWPAVLSGADFRLPTAIFANGFLTINGQKMSKSRGTFIKARTYLDHLAPEYLRYYFAAKSSSRIEDLDINLDDFAQRVNSDLVGKLVNIASRCAGFITKQFNSELAAQICEPELWQYFSNSAAEIAADYEAREFGRIVRRVMELADRANQYIDEQKPWVLAKQAEQTDKLQAVCSLGLNLFRLLILYLSPILPLLTKQVEKFLNSPPLQWSDHLQPLLKHKINTFQPLLQRIDLEKIKAMQDASQETTPITPAAPAHPLIEIDDFSKVDLRIVEIINAEAVPEADKLVKLTLSLGDETRTVFAGIKSAYAPEQLVGRLTVMVANLKPRKMRFGLSEGMVLAASGSEGSGLFLLSPDSGAKPGMKVK